MHNKIGIISMLLLAVVLTAGPGAAVPTIAFSPSSLSLGAGSTADVSVILTEAPNGLAGYELTIVTSPSIVTVTNASFPSWAALNQKTPVAGGYTISAIDLNKEVQAGATDVVLATVKVQGIGPGTASIGVSGIDISADGGDSISPSPGTLQVTVTGEGSTTTLDTTTVTTTTAATTATTVATTGTTEIPTTATATTTTATPPATVPSVSETTTGIPQTPAGTTPTQSAPDILTPLAGMLAMVVISVLFMKKGRR